MINTFTVHKINIDGSLSHKEHMNDFFEVVEWAHKKKFSNFRVEMNHNKRVKTFTWNGDEIVTITDSFKEESKNESNN